MSTQPFDESEMRARLTAEYGLSVRSDSSGTKYVSGVIVPWEAPIFHDGASEEFQKGAFDRLPQPSPIMLHYGHVEQDRHSVAPIGRMISTRSDRLGQWAEFRLGTTPLAVEIGQLAADKVLTGFSIEFGAATAPRGFGANSGRGRIVDAELRSVSIVDTPAYRAALIEKVVTRARSNHDWIQSRLLAGKVVSAPVRAAHE